MFSNRLAKRLVRTTLVSWREQPSRYDIEAVQANTRRVGLVIRVRWYLVAVLGLFSLLGASVYGLEVPPSDVLRNMLIPAAAMVFVLVYNTYYQLTYRRLGNIAFLNEAQLLFDILVTTVLVYYSGGVYSWFATMYLLFILEGTFILPRHHVWTVLAGSVSLYGLVVWLEYLGVLPHVDVPFVTNNLQRELAYVAVRFLWQGTVMIGTAVVGSMFMSDVRAREESARSISPVDESTGLCTNAHFRRGLDDAIDRGVAEGSPLAVLLMDIDHMAAFNATFGIEAGDSMLRALAAETERVVAEGIPGRAWPEALVCRFGGEEFAVLLPGADERRAMGLAEMIRSGASRLRVADGSVTVSVGLAVHPDDGYLAEDLLDAADEALSRASTGGGNRVVTASSALSTPDA